MIIVKNTGVANETVNDIYVTLLANYNSQHTVTCSPTYHQTLFFCKIIVFTELWLNSNIE